MLDFLTADFWSILTAGFLVGIVVGLTGMGGGALMTPDLPRRRQHRDRDRGRPDCGRGLQDWWGARAPQARRPPHGAGQVAGPGSIPMAFIGPFLVHSVYGGEPVQLEKVLKTAIGFALLIAAATYALRLYIGMVQIRRGTAGDWASR